MSNDIMWFMKDYKRPQYEIYLEDLSESAVRETGLSREKLKEVMDIMYEHRVIN